MSRPSVIDINHAQTGAELHFRVAAWIDANPREALKDATAKLAEHFSVSRSTAYRWLSAYRAARGEP